MPWEKVLAFLKSPVVPKKPENNRFRFPIRFATNRFTFENIPPVCVIRTHYSTTQTLTKTLYVSDVLCTLHSTTHTLTETLSVSERAQVRGLIAQGVGFGFWFFFCSFFSSPCVALRTMTYHAHFSPQLTHL